MGKLIKTPIKEDIINSKSLEKATESGILEILLERQRLLKAGLASSRPWDEIKNDLLNRKKSACL